jgi:hypothetical protein
MLQTVPEELKTKILHRAQGACECTNPVGRCSHHRPPERCSNSLGFSWELHPKQLEAPVTLGNVVAMCEQCYRNSPAYWKSKGW